MEYPKNVFLEEFGVNVRPYLKSQEISAIINSVIEIEDLVIRDMMIDELVLRFCTDFPMEEEIDLDMLYACGFLDEVKYNIKNINKIYEYIKEESELGFVVRRGINYLTNVLKEKFPDEKKVKNMLNSFLRKLQKLAK